MESFKRTIITYLNKGNNKFIAGYLLHTTANSSQTSFTCKIIPLTEDAIPTEPNSTTSSQNADDAEKRAIEILDNMPHHQDRTKIVGTGG